jgi:hypothetical protein
VAWDSGWPDLYDEIFPINPVGFQKIVGSCKGIKAGFVREIPVAVKGSVFLTEFFYGSQPGGRNIGYKVKLTGNIGD